MVVHFTLKETNMDANVTSHSQRLLNQDTFHEARRKRDKTNEDKTHSFSLEQGKHIGHLVYKTKFHTYSGRNAHYGGYPRNGFSGTAKLFRVVRDRRGDRSTSRELNSSSMPSSTLTDNHVAYFSEKRSTGTLGEHEEQKMFRKLNGSSYSASWHSPASSTATNEEKILDETNRTVLKLDSQVSRVKARDPLPYSTTTVVPNNSFGGLYSSDPVHVPLDNRLSSKIGAIKREVGVVGVRWQPAGNTSKSTSISSRPSTASKKVFQSNQTDAHESVLASLSTSRSFSSNHNRSKSYPTVNHEKATQTNKEWRPKSSQKSSLKNHGVTGTDTNTISSPAENSLMPSIKVEHLQENFLKLNILENQHVIIPEHLQVPEAERVMLTFGSFGSGLDSPRNCVYRHQEPDGAEQSNTKSCLSVSAPPSSSADLSGGSEVDLLDVLVRNPRSDFPPLTVPSGHPFPEKEESSGTQDLETYSDYALAQDINLSKPLGRLQQQQQDPLPHDVPVFKTGMNNTWQSQGLPSSKEVASSLGGNATTRMIHQQPMGQFYPPLHLSQYPNFMPCRQFSSPVFLPTMPVPGYSPNPAYSHSLNGGSYLVMPGFGSHLAPDSLKYDASQYKPIPSSSHTGLFTYANSLVYPINTQGTGVTAFEDSTAMKYKDGYVPNRQVYTSEIWVQAPQEIPGFQTSSYYNMSGQTTNAAYLPMQNTHPSFNVAATHPTQIQFSGLYHPSHHPLANPHQSVHGMPGNIGVGVASLRPGAQFGPYQQSQMNHLSWS